ncbi:hypothetical protein H2248_002974 [Termitomyces sp. 'cryptogamus']|nr:hypothetical protein H2248_002974 [Termitomyces sp. 'cryptogamus']
MLQVRAPFALSNHSSYSSFSASFISGLIITRYITTLSMIPTIDIPSAQPRQILILLHSYWWLDLSPARDDSGLAILTITKKKIGREDLTFVNEKEMGRS